MFTSSHSQLKSLTCSDVGELLRVDQNLLYSMFSLNHFMVFQIRVSLEILVNPDNVFGLVLSHRIYKLFKTLIASVLNRRLLTIIHEHDHLYYPNVAANLSLSPMRPHNVFKVY